MNHIKRHAAKVAKETSVLRLVAYEKGDRSVGLWDYEEHFVIHTEPHREFTDEEVGWLKEAIQSCMCPDGKVFTEAEWQAMWESECEE